MDGKAISIVFLSLFASVLILKILSIAFPKATIINKLFEKTKPRTDIKYMTKKELYESAFIFFTWSSYLFILLYLVTIFTKGELGNSPYIMGTFFILMILFAMAMGASMVLYVRGLFRKESYVPPSVIPKN